MISNVVRSSFPEHESPQSIIRALRGSLRRMSEKRRRSSVLQDLLSKRALEDEAQVVFVAFEAVYYRVSDLCPDDSM